jgi:PHD/YefM family antitoxin component YafN of YafNO toxin-antitoxin module
MYATYQLKADELTDEIVQTLKNTYHQHEIVILSKEAYDDLEKARHNEAFTEKLRRGMRDIEEGRGIVKTMAELEAMAHG